ncbi:RNA-binding protein NOB1-like [Ornithodoros turicata]|uniref:RNA-binding protein NOB1 n=1 Tax=Ornithodoros turicata TaxID=34597 RepID=A0A2R5L8K6_9ACAR
MDPLTFSTAPKITNLVVDSGGFIKNHLLQGICQNVYTIPEVVNEIKDKATKERLAFLPYKLNYRVPPPEIIKIVTDFSKLTGDYPSLSAVDLKVIALTYLLEKENVGTSHLHKEPKATQILPHGMQMDRTVLPGHFLSSGEDKKSGTHHTSVECMNNCIHGTESEVEVEKDNSDSQGNEDTTETNAYLSDEDSSWVTPTNIEDVKRAMGELRVDDAEIPVACLSTDFAIQNVLIQMGLKATSVDGMMIRRAQTFILRCHACFATTKIMTKEFCPTCGNRTLKRVSVSLDADGNTTLFINFKKPINIRGKRFSLPMPKGGKHANNPILCEDQRIPQNRPSKMALRKLDALDPDYVTNSSPFKINDVYSRSAHLDVRLRHRGARDPNTFRKNTGNHKKRK